MTSLGQHQSNVVKSDDNDSEINYGTHTLPKKFWTSGKPPLLKDEDFKARRAAKHARHLQNVATRAAGGTTKRGK